jgi:hypothetical protein
LLELASHSGSHRQANAEKTARSQQLPDEASLLRLEFAYMYPTRIALPIWPFPVPRHPAPSHRPPTLRRRARSQLLPAEASLLLPECAGIYLTHEYGPFQGRNISSVTTYAAYLPACLLICIFS